MTSYKHFHSNENGQKDKWARTIEHLSQMQSVIFTVWQYRSIGRKTAMLEPECRFLLILHINVYNACFFL